MKRQLSHKPGQSECDAKSDLNGRRAFAGTWQRWHRGCLLLIFCLLTFTITGSARSRYRGYDDPQNHIYQFEVSVGSRTAYLWLPPRSRSIRGVIVSFSNLLERCWLEDPLIRKVVSDIGLGIIWIGPAQKGDGLLTADMKPEMIVPFQKMLNDFASVSGYEELRKAPVIPMGHSANGQFAWTFASLQPGRTITAIPVKTAPLPADLKISGIPLCYIVGQTTEWPQFRVPDPTTKPGDRDYFWPVVQQSALRLRAADANNLISVVIDPGGGHFDWSERLSTFLAQYIRTACKYRLTGDGSKLNPVLKENGWLTGSAGMAKETFSLARYKSFKGPEAEGYWFFDQKIAKEAMAFQGDRVARKKQMPTFLEDGRAVSVARLGYAPLAFRPDSDGVTFELQPDFLTSVPPELVGSGAVLGHAPGPVRLQLITGPAIQVSPTRFQLRFDRGEANEIWIQESKDGDQEYRYAVQPAKITLPPRLNEGAEQTIDFGEINNVTTDTRAVSLSAKAGSGLPVSYYVRSGPAYVNNNTLILTDIPLRSRMPIKVTVVAYQYGRASGPSVQSAPLVERSFYIIP